jgi:hypothetical protein
MLGSDGESFDVSSVTKALRLHPDEFVMRGAQVLHLPTGLQFTFSPMQQISSQKFFGPQRISHLSCLTPKDHPDLYEAFAHWHSNYWQIIERNERADSPYVFRRWKRVRRMIKALLSRFGDAPNPPVIPGA